MLIKQGKLQDNGGGWGEIDQHLFTFAKEPHLLLKKLYIIDLFEDE